MAIAENRLKVTAVAKLSKVDFETEEEIVKSDGEASNEENSVSPNEAQAVHDTPANAKYENSGTSSKTSKVSKANTSNERSAATVESTKIDKQLTAKASLNGSVIGMTPRGDKKLDTVIKTELSDIVGNNRSLSMDKLSAGVKSQIEKVGQALGGDTLKNKLNIDYLLNKCIDDSGSNYNAGDFEFIAILSLSGLLDNILCAGVDAAISAIAAVTGTDRASIMKILSSIKKTLNSTNDDKSMEKLLVMRTIVDNSESEEEKDVISIQTKGAGDIVISTIDNSSYQTNSPISDYTNLIESLNTVDGSWNTDNGEINYSNAAGSEKITRLAENNALNRDVLPAVFTGEVTTDIDASIAITVINSVKREYVDVLGLDTPTRDSLLRRELKGPTGTNMRRELAGDGTSVTAILNARTKTKSLNGCRI